LIRYSWVYGTLPLPLPAAFASSLLGWFLTESRVRSNGPRLLAGRAIGVSRETVRNQAARPLTDRIAGQAARHDWPGGTVIPIEVGDTAGSLAAWPARVESFTSQSHAPPAQVDRSGSRAVRPRSKTACLWTQRKPLRDTSEPPVELRIGGTDRHGWMRSPLRQHG
jgi:hypothetical protein